MSEVSESAKLTWGCFISAMMLICVVFGIGAVVWIWRVALS